MAEATPPHGFEAGPVLRGVLIGGSIGMIAGWFGFDMGRALALGLICGLAAGLTKRHLDKRAGRNGKQ